MTAHVCTDKGAKSGGTLSLSLSGRRSLPHLNSPTDDDDHDLKNCILIYTQYKRNFCLCYIKYNVIFTIVQYLEQE